MSEENSHNNPWADKLKHLPVPDVNDNWNNMQALLDKEMPVTTRNSNLKWLLLLLLLLLLIGVCNCPGLRRENKISRKDSENPAAANSNRQRSDTPVDKTLPKEPVNKTLEETKHTPRETINNGSDAGSLLNPADNNMAKSINKKQANISGQLNNTQAHPSLKEEFNKRDVPANDLTNKDGMKTMARTTGPDNLPEAGHKKNRNHKTPSVSTSIKSAIPSNNNKDMGKRDPNNKKQIDDSDSSMASNKNKDSNRIKPTDPPSDTTTGSRKTNTIDTAKTVADTTSVKIAPADSARKQTNRGFVIALGLNQFFAIGTQQASSFNSNGTSGVLADYIPVPAVRYHFNRKLYVQVEAQFNAPQYTGNILARQSPPDSSRPGPPSQRSVYIKKLFYFNLPFSVHYSPVKNFYLGTGLQFSQLKNAVGLFENKRIGSTAQDTSNTAKFQTLKSDDSTYSLLKTNEWRFLIDANYQWNRFTLGLRYNQAFNYFINTRISNQEITQARNNSLQLYLRFAIWDGRKK